MNDNVYLIDVLCSIGGTCAYGAKCSACAARSNGCKYYDAYAARADVLMRNGVSILPCKIGDTAYCTRTYWGQRTVTAGVISAIRYDGPEMRLVVTVHGLARGYIGEQVFLTQEEAERALQHECTV